MKHILLFLCFFASHFAVEAQVVLAERVADLVPGDYAIQGTASLQEQEGEANLKFVLSDDFDTPFGPDVRIMLSNSLSTSGAVEIVNLTSINHFRGGITLDVPAGVEIEDYDFILFFCVAFQQFWASGELGQTMNPGGDFACLASSTSGENGISEIGICPSDNVSDVINLFNDLNEVAGEHYAYLITDENELLQAVVLDNTFNFEGSSTQTQRVYGIHFDGMLNPAMGANRLETTASECFTHSENDFLTITKNACNAPFECQESLVATHDWVTMVNVCATDGAADEVFIQNNIDTDPGQNYVFLLTDENEILQEIIVDSIYNFEGTGIEEQRVYGMSFGGTLDAAVGEHRSNTTASGCFIHSGDNAFITINKLGACATAVLDPAVAQQIKTFPSPVSDVLNIELPAAFAPTELAVFNTLGERVLLRDVTSTNRLQLAVGSFSTGTYILQLRDEQDVFSRRFIVL